MDELLRTAVRRMGITRARVASLRAGCERTALALRGRSSAARPRARILCYHSVGTPAWGINDVSPRRFRRQIEAALSAGYEFVEPCAALDGDGEGKRLAITFDDGLASVARHAAPVLAEFGIPWTLFVVTDWADGNAPFDRDLFLRWRDIERLQAHGATIGSHSVTHTRLSSLSADAVAHELAQSRAVIQSRLGVAPSEFAVPIGRSADWSATAAEAARAAGYRSVYAACESRRPPGTLPRTMVTSWDGDRIFRAALNGRFDDWEEWLW